MREMIAVVLASILFLYSGLEARAGAGPAVPARAQSETEHKPTVKERILEIPPGTMIEVRLTNKERLRGRLGEITDEGFAVQTAKGNKIETRKIAFDEVKSLKKVGGGKAGKTIGFTALGVLVGIGVLFLIAFLVYVARS